MPSATAASAGATVWTGEETEAIRAHLGRVLASREFAGAPKLARFLTFVVETALAGDKDQIKESLIAVEVYGRPPDYNPQIDSTVRVEAGRLRTRLRQYYEASGAAEPLRIELPKGTYAPSFTSIAMDVRPEPAPVSVTEVPDHPVKRSRRFGLLHAAVLAAALVAIVGEAVFLFSRNEETADAKTMETFHRAQELLSIPVLKNGQPDSLPASVVEAVQLFRQVTTQSPRFARGWLGLAEALEWEYELRGNKPPELLRDSKASVLRTLDLEPDLQDAWTLLTSILLYREWNLPEAEKACLRALQLDPRNTTARQRYIDALRAQGRQADARVEVDKALKLQPSVAAFHIRKATMLYESGNCDEATPIAVYASDLTNRMPSYTKTLWVQGLCFEKRGQYAEAESMFRKAIAYQPHDLWSEPALGHLLAISGRHAEAEEILTELRRQSARGRTTQVAMALVYTGLGKKNDALLSLERGMAERDDAILTIATEPRFGVLQWEPRFQALVAQLRGVEKR